jgi:murein tripeptide amidase MpaA
MLEDKQTRWIGLALVFLAVLAAVGGLLIGFSAVRRVGNSNHASALPAASVTPTDGGAPLSSSPPTDTPNPPSTALLLPSLSPSPEPLPTATPMLPPLTEGPFVYGHSVEGRPLLAYRIGRGPSARAIIGSIHGGYEWNTAVLVSETLEHLLAEPSLVPAEVTLYVVPCANPDGCAAGPILEYGRVNGNNVDLNRNWDYQWQMTATHGTRPVYAGAYPFSEPETAALRDLILEQNVEAVIFYHSAMARIFYGVERERSASYELAEVVSEATGYPISHGVPGQITTGDAVDWMSAQGLAGIEVEMTDHQSIEWERNWRGVLAFLHWNLLPASQPVASFVRTTRIGESVEGRPLEATQIGNGERLALVIIGSIHGDEVHTEALVRRLMQTYLDAPDMVPAGATLYFLPTINPDGLAAGTRFSARQVDLNRNWPTDDWWADAARTRGVIPGSGGAAPGSEPEVQAVARWLQETVAPSARETLLLSYHAAYPPAGGVQPGYSTYGTPGSEAEQLARRVADLTGYTYLAAWSSERRFTGELIHWCDVNGIWAADVELPSYDPPDTAVGDGAETTLVIHQRLLRALLADGGGASADGEYTRYIVRRGDTLLGIAFQYVDDADAAFELVKEIVRWNGIVNDHIEVGQELLIPGPKKLQ